MDASSNVYVVDLAARRVQKFDPSGAFLAKWGSPGSGDGQFSRPSGLAVDESGGVYVADTFNQRIQKFDPFGTFLTKWGSFGSGDGQFACPSDVALDGSGNVYVADMFNRRIQVFGPPALPDDIIDIPHTADPHGYSSTPLPDGDSHFFHLRTCDNVGGCTTTVHLGPFWIDSTAPTGPTGLTSTSHTPGVPTSLQVIDMGWTAASDALSGLDGYAYEFNSFSTPACDQAKDFEGGATGISSASLVDGTWFFHLCAVDNAGNWTSAVTAGPYPIDGSPPGAPSALTSTTHVPGTWSNLSQVTVEWSGRLRPDWRGRLFDRVRSQRGNKSGYGHRLGPRRGSTAHDQRSAR